jgi:predicted peptidase
MGLPKRLEHDGEFPFIVASPLLPEGEIWTDVSSLMELVHQVARDYRVDPARIYVTGHSMGGRGALYLAYRHPDRFAAVAAISPYTPITAWSKRLADVPLWFIHGAKDVQAPIKDTEELVQAVEKAGGKPRFTALPGADHFILDWYDRNEIFDWLLEQRRADALTTAGAR